MGGGGCLAGLGHQIVTFVCPLPHFPHSSCHLASALQPEQTAGGDAQGLKTLHPTPESDAQNSKILWPALSHTVVGV